AARDVERCLLRRDGGHIVPAMRPIGRQPDIVAQLEVSGEMLEVRVIRSGLEEEHRSSRVLRQAGCQDAPGRPGANDNDVVFHKTCSFMDVPLRCKSRQYTPGPTVPQACYRSSAGWLMQYRLGHGATPWPPSSTAKNWVTARMASARAVGSVPTVAPQHPPGLLRLRTSGR